MKNTLIFFVFFAVPNLAINQTLEYQFTGDQGQIYQVAPNEYVYGIKDDSTNQFNVYSLDYNPIATFHCNPDSAENFEPFNLSRTLFNGDNTLELCYYWWYSWACGIKIINENQTIIFSKDNAGYPSFTNTPLGAKMLLPYFNFCSDFHHIDVYNLYGTVLESAEINSQSYNRAYPNPGSSIIKIDFNIPDNQRDLILSIFSINGKLLQNQRIQPKSKSIDINVSLYKPGIYLYKISNSTFTTEANKFIVR
jgi:hypothetical protein